MVKKRSKVLGGVALLAVALLALTLCRDHRSTPEIVIGAFNFPESAILSNIYGGALRDSGYSVTFRTNLGSREVVGPALEDGDIDVYLGYAARTSSSGMTTPARRRRMPPRRWAC